MHGYLTRSKRFLEPRVGKRRSRALFLALIVIIGLGGVKPNGKARAATPTDETIDSFIISTSAIPSPACAHSHYDVQFSARIDRVADLNGQKTDLQGGLGPPVISVKATSSDPSIAGFSPEIATANAVSGLIGQGAKFNLNTEEAGSATLTFLGKSEWSGLSVIFPPLQQSIRVVHCRFNITITGIAAGSADNRFITQTFTATGEISGDPDAALKGTAEATWNQTQVGDCYTATVRIPPSTINLEGSLSADGETVTVRFKFDPIMVFTQVQNCGGYSGNGQGQLQPPPVVVTVPITGRNLSQSYSIADGVVTLSGAAIISVVPIEGK